MFGVLLLKTVKLVLAKTGKNSLEGCETKILPVAKSVNPRLSHRSEMSVKFARMADKHQPDSSNSVQMGIRHKQGMPMQSQFEQAILDVYDFCIKEKEAGVPIIPLNHFSKRVCELLKVSS